MFWPRRRYTPWWMRILAMIGLQFLLRRIATETRSSDADWRAKKRRFRQKLREAFQVWQDPANASADDSDVPPAAKDS